MAVTIFDLGGFVSYTTSAPSIPLPIGTQWQAGDKRIIWVSCPTGLTFQSFATWTKIHDQLVTGSGRVGIFTKVLTAGAGDGTLQFSTVGGYEFAAFTVRGWDSTQTLTATTSGSSTASVNAVAPSITTGLGQLLTFHTTNTPDSVSSPYYTTPAGMTLQRTTQGRVVPGTAGRWQYGFFSEPRTTGTSGTRTASNVGGIYAGPWRATSLFVRGLADTTVTLGKATAADTGKTMTVAFGPTTITMGKAIEPPTVARALINPLQAVWQTPPMVLKEGVPVASSVIAWAADTPGGSSVLVETSTDNGATWQTATDGEPVPRLLVGTTVAKTVIARVTLRRASVGSATPVLRRLELRIALDGTNSEYIPIGVFTLNESEIHDGMDGLTIELSGTDLSRRVSRNRWETTYVLYAGTNVGTAIQRIVGDRLPGTQFNFASTEDVTPTLFFGEDSSNDPWQDALDLALGAGMELYFDPRGICCLRPEPNPDIDSAVWDFEDLVNPTILDVTRRVTDENTYNRVVVIGEGSALDAPVRGEAEDDDPASPTYVLGPYGFVTQVVRSNMILTSDQAQRSAESLLLRQKGATEEIELQVIPNPALEPGDIVNVKRSRSKIYGSFVIDSMQIPLGAQDSMRIVSRRQRLG